MVTCNATGTKKQPLLFIHKNQTPRAREIEFTRLVLLERKSLDGAISFLSLP